MNANPVLVHAEAMLQALQIDFLENKVFSMTSSEGDGPGEDTEKWRQLLRVIA